MDESLKTESPFDGMRTLMKIGSKSERLILYTPRALTARSQIRTVDYVQHVCEPCIKQPRLAVTRSRLLHKFKILLNSDLSCLGKRLHLYVLGTRRQNLRMRCGGFVPCVPFVQHTA